MACKDSVSKYTACGWDEFDLCNYVAQLVVNPFSFWKENSVAVEHLSLIPRISTYMTKL